jgi:GNAT superfamily N-acetyltransferase
MGRMGVRRVRAEEWVALRNLRLRALAEAPEAFLVTLVEARLRTGREWRQFAAGGAVGAETAVFVDEAFEGMAGGRLTLSGAVVLFGMWVAPRRRGGPLASELVDAVVGWAREVGAGRIVLNVVADNHRAARLYEKCGFAPSGVRGEMRGSPNLEYELRLDGVGGRKDNEAG